MPEECLGQAQVPPVETVAQGSEEDIQSLLDDLYEYARHNLFQHSGDKYAGDIRICQKV